MVKNPREHEPWNSTPTNNDGHSMLAMYHRWNGEYEQAPQALLKRLEVDPAFFPARANVGENKPQEGRSGSLDPPGPPEGRRFRQDA